MSYRLTATQQRILNRMYDGFELQLTSDQKYFLHRCEKGKTERYEVQSNFVRDLLGAKLIAAAQPPTFESAFVLTLMGTSYVTI